MIKEEIKFMNNIFFLKIKQFYLLIKIKRNLKILFNLDKNINYTILILNNNELDSLKRYVEKKNFIKT